jgi:ribosomal-protein-serine acetyltransferase
VLTALDGMDSEDLWSAISASRNELEPWLPWVSFTEDPASTEQYAEASANEWDTGRACRLAIRCCKSHEFLGVVGFEGFAQQNESVDLGYWLRSDFTGNGLMTEAARMALEWAFEHINAHRVRVAAATDNHPSLGVIARLGFRFEGIARHAEKCHGRWLDHAVFGMLCVDSARPRNTYGIDLQQRNPKW